MGQGDVTLSVDLRRRPLEAWSGRSNSRPAWPLRRRHAPRWPCSIRRHRVRRRRPQLERFHRPVRPKSIFPTRNPDVQLLALPAPRLDEPIWALRDPQKPGTRPSLRSPRALDQRFSREATLERTAVLDQSRDPQRLAANRLGRLAAIVEPVPNVHVEVQHGDRIPRPVDVRTGRPPDHVVRLSRAIC